MVLANDEGKQIPKATQIKSKGRDRECVFCWRRLHVFFSLKGSRRRAGLLLDCSASCLLFSSPNKAPRKGCRPSLEETRKSYSCWIGCKFSLTVRQAFFIPSITLTNGVHPDFSCPCEPMKTRKRRVKKEALPLFFSFFHLPCDKFRNRVIRILLSLALSSVMHLNKNLLAFIIFSPYHFKPE